MGRACNEDMNLPRKILVPTDFSEHAEAALDYALALAKALGGAVHVMHFYQIPSFGAFEPAGLVTESTFNAIEHAAKLSVEELVKRKQMEGVSLDGEAVLGDTRMGIESAVEGLGADLVCMGTHGRRGVRRALLGSVAEYTVRTSKVPVIAMHSEAKPKRAAA
jgi:nucleotide-binding universal stress UspA family protein